MERDAGGPLLACAVDRGENLYASTAPAGRDRVRHALRDLKQRADTLSDLVTSAQRHLEVNLVQWRSFEESRTELEAWLERMEAELGAGGVAVALHSTLEEKKAQLQAYKVRTKLVGRTAGGSRFECEISCIRIINNSYSLKRVGF